MAELNYLQVTRDCNQICEICSNPPSGMHLSYEQAKKEIDIFIKKKCDGVILTGGEPTIYPQLPDLIRYCIEKGIHPRIITNGQRTADINYLKKLRDAGLEHIHISIYSCRPEVQGKMTQNRRCLERIEKSLVNFAKFGDMTIVINTAISKDNADHLSETVAWLLEKHNVFKHVVYNNLDPYDNRATENPDIIPTLIDSELELHKALSLLEKHNKTFRVERVPLCYLTDYEHVSTETRKIVKGEERIINFLDSKGKLMQDNWYYSKTECCKVCLLNRICSGYYRKGADFDGKELYPVFIDPNTIIEKIRSGV